MQEVTGMEGVINSLSSTLSSSNLWDIVGQTVPIIGISVLFGLGFYIVKRVLNKIKRAKGGI